MTRPCITSISNPRLKSVRRLRRSPGDDGVFLVEGHRLLCAALEARAVVRELFACPELFLGSADAGLVRLAERRGARVVELGAEAFASISAQVRPDGLVGVVQRWPTGLERLRLGPRPLLLVAESVERPGNLGMLVRTACGAGASGIVCCDARTDVFHPEVVRGSVGTVFRLPLARSPGARAVSWLREGEFRIVVATPNGRCDYWAADYSGPVAVVVGNERYGVTARWLEAADETVRIAMPGPADSLNVAIAAGVVLFEAARQRAAIVSSR